MTARRTSLPVRKRRRPRHDITNAVIQGNRVIKGNHKIVVGPTRALMNLARATGGGAGGVSAATDLARRLREAAQIIADQARVNAAGWSVRVPPSIRVTGGGVTISISSNAPPAYPNEVEGVKHPVFGGRGTKRPKAPWVLNQYRPFLAPAADEKADAALEAFSKVIEDWAREHGFK